MTALSGSDARARSSSLLKAAMAVTLMVIVAAGHGVDLARLTQNQGHFLRERAVNIDPGTILRLDETIVERGGESVEPPLSCVSPTAS